MKIAIDLRSLSSGSISGVENYIVNLLDSLLTLDTKNRYVLFYNSWKKHSKIDFHFINSEMKKTNFPNRLLNLALKTSVINLEKLCGGFDCLFLPNLNQFSILPQTKLAITVHDLSPVITPEFYDIKRRLWHTSLNYKKSFERANVIFAVSEYTKHDLIKIFNLPPEKIKVVYPGIDQKVFNPQIEKSQLIFTRNSLDLPGSYFLFLSTIEPRKNLANLVKAFERIKSPEYLVIAGRKGWKYEEILKNIRKSKKLSKIRLLGYLEEQHKPAIISMSKAVIYPSFYEGFGFIPLEAQSIGVPTLVSQVTSLPEVVKNGSLLINPYSIESITKGLIEINENKTLRSLLIEKGLKASVEFTWKKTAENTLAGLEAL